MAQVGTFVAIAYMSWLESGGWGIEELLIRPGLAHEYDLPAEERSWQPTGAPHLTMAGLRSIRLTTLIEEVSQIDSAVMAAMEEEDWDTQRLLASRDAVLERGPHAFGFRSTRDLEAHFDRLTAAFVYAGAPTSGAASPVGFVADALGVTRERASIVIAEARRTEYLTSASRGVAQGNVTEKATNLFTQFVSTTGGHT